MEKKLWEDSTFVWIFFVSIIVVIVMAILADTGSFWKDLFLGVGMGALCMICISSAFMSKR